jgi:hypothetical protein
MKKDFYKDIFAPDKGSLLDVRVFDTTLQDWQSVLDYLSAHYVIRYSENWVSKPLPSAEVIWKKRQQVTVLLEIELSGFNVNAHFFVENEIEIDIRPEDVDSRDKTDSVFEFMTSLATVLGKEVFLVPEHGKATEAELREMAVCSGVPGRGLTVRLGDNIAE